MSQDLFGWMLILAPGLLALAFVGAAMIGGSLRERALHRGSLELVSSHGSAMADEAQAGSRALGRFNDF